MLYTALEMSPTRTQIYLTAEQRRRLDELARRRGTTLAQLIREAVERYLETSGPDAAVALEGTFGSAPGLEIPSRDEWDRG
jgi:predicted transcriptional regulator